MMHTFFQKQDWRLIDVKKQLKTQGKYSVITNLYEKMPVFTQTLFTYMGFL